jgi:hypothetical protein
MKPITITYEARDPSKPNLKSYTVTAMDVNEAVDLVIPMIQRDHPGIDLEKDYNPFPNAEWPGK